MAGNTKIILDVQANISQIKNAANEINSIFSKLNLPQSMQKSFTGTFNTLTQEIKNFEVAADKGFSTLNDVSRAQKSLDKINDSFTRLKLLGKDLSGVDMKKLLPDNLVEKYRKLQDAMKQVETLQKQDNSQAIKQATRQYENQQAAVKKLEKNIAELEAKNNTLNSGKKTFASDLEEARKKANEIVTEMTRLEQDGGKGSARYTQLKSDFSNIQAEIRRLEGGYNDLDKNIIKNQATIDGYKSSLQSEESTLAALKTKLDEITSSGTNTAALEQLRNTLANLTNTNLKEIPTDLEGIKAKIQEAASSGPELERITQALLGIKTNAETGATQTAALGTQLQNTAGKGISEMNRLNSEMSMLKSRFSYFFSIINGFQLFKRAIRSAYNSVKELDAAMTQMAVVTKYNVGDLWNQMPQYAANANQLGATTLDVYKSMVLYTQQGLEAAQAQELSNQTLRMARISGMEASDATDAMTSALRGFNMELTEASGQRINDVYSNLAAHAAANTEEISNAMMRTASIAHSAGMEFENTAAFLTQMINHATLARVA